MRVGLVPGGRLPDEREVRISLIQKMFDITGSNRCRARSILTDKDYHMIETIWLDDYTDLEIEKRGEWVEQNPSPLNPLEAVSEETLAALALGSSAEMVFQENHF